MKIKGRAFGFQSTISNHQSKMHSLGILLSGRGSNFVAIADSIDAGRIADARIVVVISNKADAPGIATAHRNGTAARIDGAGDSVEGQATGRA